MLKILIDLLLCSLPVIFIFLILHQVLNWKINPLHWGIIVFESSISFLPEIPEYLTNRVIEYKGLTFKFISPKIGLFQSKVSRWSLNDDHPSTSLGFLLLDEIVLDKASIAKIVLRIPYSNISLFLCTMVSFLGFIVLSNEINIDFFDIIASASLISGFVFVLFKMEEANLQSGSQRIKEYILKNI